MFLNCLKTKYDEEWTFTFVREHFREKNNKFSQKHDEEFIRLKPNGEFLYNAETGVKCRTMWPLCMWRQSASAWTTVRCSFYFFRFKSFTYYCQFQDIETFLLKIRHEWPNAGQEFFSFYFASVSNLLQ